MLILKKEYKMFNFKITHFGGLEKWLQLRTLTILPEDSGSMPGTQHSGS